MREIQINNTLLVGGCDIWLNAMEAFLTNNAYSQNILFCDLDAMPLKTLRKYQGHKIILGFFKNKVSKKKKNICSAVFKKSAPLYKIISTVNGAENTSKYCNYIDQILLKSLQNGLNDKQISYALCIPLSTVKYYLRMLYKKLNVSNRTQAALVAIESGV